MFCWAREVEVKRHYRHRSQLRSTNYHKRHGIPRDLSVHSCIIKIQARILSRIGLWILGAAGDKHPVTKGKHQLLCPGCEARLANKKQTKKESQIVKYQGSLATMFINYIKKCNLFRFVYCWGHGKTSGEWPRSHTWTYLRYGCITKRIHGWLLGLKTGVCIVRYGEVRTPTMAALEKPINRSRYFGFSLSLVEFSQVLNHSHPYP